MVIQLAEVLFPKTVERRAVELRGAADEVVNLRLEGLPLRVVPGVFGHVAIVDEDRSVLSARLGDALLPPLFQTPRYLGPAEIDRAERWGWLRPALVGRTPS